MILRKINIALLILALAGCAAKKTTAPPKPQWVLTTPVIEGYYTGVGSALKTVDISAYKDKAQNNALSDLSSSISVNISSRSVLYSFENSAGYSDDFQSKIKASSNQYLEGYELVDSFDDGTYYWEYYRLSKAKYQELKAKRIREACAIAVDYLLKAEKEQETNQVYNALVYYIKGIEAVKQFWTEPLEYQHNGSNVFLGNELFSGLSKLLSGIVIEPLISDITIKQGVENSDNKIEFIVKSQSGANLSGIPIEFYANKRPVVNNKTASDTDGIIRYNTSLLPSKSDNIRFTAALNLEEITIKSTRDITLKKIISSLNVNSGVVNIVLQKPTFFIQTDEKVLTRNTKLNVVQQKAEQILTDNGYVLTHNKAEADLILSFTVNTINKKQDGGMFYAGLRAEMKILNTNNEIIMSKSIHDIEGVQSSFKEASKDAYKNFNVYLSKKLITIINEAVLK